MITLEKANSNQSEIIKKKIIEFYDLSMRNLGKDGFQKIPTANDLTFKKETLR